ncbi:uncharacterized protein LOC131983053 [Centropristis striata]|uniref:uncharacterized protein LOC131983053 n=1 Tax=Centropristis striata TaxID=184440 RepID=UPI0027DF05B0|nr:uncharacterized protein LOC131983053 [Centropristis striata]
MWAFPSSYFFYCVTNTSSGEDNTAAGCHIASAMGKKDCPPGHKWDSLICLCKPICPADSKWDSLLKVCLFSKTETRPEPEPPTTQPPTVHPLTHVVQLRAMDPTEPSLPRGVQLRTPTAQVNSVMLLSPALWTFVVLAILGSILTLALWFIIYRRQTRHSSTSEDAEPQREPLQKTEPSAQIHPTSPERNSQAQMLQQAASAPSPCPHRHLGAQTGSLWEQGFTACRDPAKHAGTEGGRGLATCSTMREHRIPLPATELGGTALVTTKTV